MEASRDLRNWPQPDSLRGARVSRPHASELSMHFWIIAGLPAASAGIYTAQGGLLG